MSLLRGVAETIDALDEQIRDAQSNAGETDPSQIFSLCARRNTLASPLCRIPAEILQEILHEIILVCFELQSRYSGVVPTTTLPASGYSAAFATCTHIRSLALDSPIVWSYIHLGQAPEWIDLCIERARSSPLTLVMWPRTPAYEERLAALFTRTKELIVHLLGRGWASPLVLARLLHDPMPHLYSLMVSTNPALELGSHFLEGKPTLLTRLNLHQVDVISIACLPALVDLRLHNVKISRSMADLIQTLGNSPLLEYVSVSAIHCVEREVVSMRIELPHLQNLNLDADIFSVSVLLRNLPDPSSNLSIRIRTCKYDLKNATSIALQHKVLDRLRRRSETDMLFQIVAEEGPRWSLRLSHLEEASYVNTFPVGYEFQPLLLSALSSLVIHPRSGSILFAAAAKNPAVWFPMVQHVVIEQKEIEQLGIQAWLRARVNADSRLMTLTVMLRGTEQSPELADAKAEIIKEELVDYLRIPGANTVWTRQGHDVVSQMAMRHAEVSAWADDLLAME
jgi:hypothetical protein